MTPKTPTPQGISALLRKAGHSRAVIKIRGGRAGFDVHTDLSTGNVKVEHYALTMGGYSEVKLAEYAKTITEAGWTVEAGTYELIVTAKPASLLAAKEADR
jgi:hypothetical protein